MNPTNARKSWIDASRALAVLFVIYGHAVKSFPAFFILANPVKVPLFFVISGYVFQTRNGDAKAFYRNLLLKLALPWLILTIPQNLLRGIIHGNLNIPTIVLNILSGKEFWYMPCFILAEAMFFWIARMQGPVWKPVAASLVLTAAGFTMLRWNVGNFARFSTACIAQILLLAGWLYRRYESRLTLSGLDPPSRIFSLGGLALVYAGLALANVKLAGHGLNMAGGQYGILPLSIAEICLGAYLLFELFKRIPVPRWLRFVGMNALFFYLFEQMFRGTISRTLARIGFVLPGARLHALLISFLACIGLSIGAMLLNRFLPLAVGKRRPARKIGG